MSPVVPFYRWLIALFQKLNSWFNNKLRPSASESTSKSNTVAKSAITTKRKSARDMYIQEHKTEINKAIQEAGKSGPGPFQQYVSAQFDQMSTEELAHYESKAAEHNQLCARPASELDIADLSRYVPGQCYKSILISPHQCPPANDWFIPQPNPTLVHPCWSSNQFEHGVCRWWSDSESEVGARAKITLALALTDEQHAVQKCNSLWWNRGVCWCL